MYRLYTLLTLSLFLDYYPLASIACTWRIIRLRLNSIHSIGFSHGKSPPRSHDRTDRVYPSPTTSATTTGESKNGIVGTSDLLHFEDESHVFGDAQEDFSYTMSDPSGKYMFDVNLERYSSRRRMSIENENGSNNNHTIAAAINNTDLFVAHYVNDASYADFSSVVNAAKALMQRQQQSIGNGNSNGDNDFVGNCIREGEELDAAAARLAVDYLGSSTGTSSSSSAAVVEHTGFNIVNCGFGPPPLMAYVTTRSVRKGEELLASYGLGYWLGKAFPDEDDAVLDAALAALDARPEVRQAQNRADDAVVAALDAGDRVVRTEYGALTKLIRDTFRGLRKDRRRQQRR